MLSEMTPETKREFIKDAKTQNMSMLNMKKHLILKIYIVLCAITLIGNIILFIKTGWTESMKNTTSLSIGVLIGLLLVLIYISDNTSRVDMKYIRHILNQLNIQTDIVSIIGISEENNTAYLTVCDKENNKYDVIINRRFRNELSQQLQTNDIASLVVTIAVKDNRLIHYTAE